MFLVVLTAGPGGPGGPSISMPFKTNTLIDYYFIFFNEEKPLRKAKTLLIELVVIDII